MKDIDVTGVDLIAAVKGAYALSQPQGLGFLHFQPGGLSDEEAQEIVERGKRFGGVSMDYVKGRACKFHIREKDGRLLTPPKWYDHSDGQHDELLTSLGIEQSVIDEARGADE